MPFSGTKLNTDMAAKGNVGVGRGGGHGRDDRVPYGLGISHDNVNCTTLNLELA